MENTKILNGEDERFKRALNDIATDRALSKKAVDKEFPASAEITLSQFPETARETVQKNIELLRAENGHRGAMLRRRALSGTSLAANHLRRLYEWSVNPNGEKETLAAEIPEALGGEVGTPERLFETLVFFERHPDVRQENIGSETASKTAEAAGISSENPKWIDLIDPIFSSENPKTSFEKLFKEVGFIPEELTTKKKWKSIGADVMIKNLEALREMEKNEEEGEIARYERSRILNAALAGGNFNSLRKGGEYMTLDSNGIFLNLPGFHMHLPYGLISDGARESLLRDNWLSEEELSQVDIRRAEENSRLEEKEEATKKELELFAKKLGLENSDAGTIADFIAKEPEKYAKRFTEEKHYLPDLVAENMAGRGKIGVNALARFGESVTSSLTDAIINEQKSSDPYKILHEADEEYAARSRIVNSPGYYNAHKALRAMLGADLSSDSENEFLAIRGVYKRARNGNRHSFLEIFNKGIASRILLDEDKHLSAADKKNFENLPLYEKDRYEELERALRTYQTFHLEIRKLRSSLFHHSDILNARNEAIIALRYQGEAILHFLLQNSDQKHYRAAKESLSIILNNSLQTDKWGKIEENNATEFLKIAENAEKEYRAFLYGTIGTQTNFIETFMPEVIPEDIQFGPEFYKHTKDLCAENGIDEKLSSQNTVSRIVKLNYRSGDPSSTMPFHIEEQALEKLRIDRDRPFINIVGGCARAGTEKEDPLRKMSQAVMSVAHQIKANVAVPGTQSGLGKYFGEENVRYLLETEHLPMREKAHLFAITPGGSVAFPGNPYLNPKNKNEIYALTPVDQIITPFDAGWHLKGSEKRNSRYPEHVAQMESQFDRSSAGQRRLTVVGNGGLYTAMEIIEAFKRGFSLFLVKNSGRLAEVLSKHIYEKMFYDRYDFRNTPEQNFKQIMEVLSKLPTEVAEEFMKKDFGQEEKPENDEFAYYREVFYELLRTIHRDYRRTRSLPLEELEENLEQYMKSNEPYRRYPGEWL